VGEEPNHTINNNKKLCTYVLVFYDQFIYQQYYKVVHIIHASSTILPTNFQQSTKNSEQCVGGASIGASERGWGVGAFSGRYMGEKRQVAAPKSIYLPA
jgi:hypothetical protein